MGVEAIDCSVGIRHSYCYKIFVIGIWVLFPFLFQSVGIFIGIVKVGRRDGGENG